MYVRNPPKAGQKPEPTRNDPYPEHAALAFIQLSSLAWGRANVAGTIDAEGHRPSVGLIKELKLGRPLNGAGQLGFSRFLRMPSGNKCQLEWFPFRWDSGPVAHQTASFSKRNVQLAFPASPVLVLKFAINDGETL